MREECLKIFYLQNKFHVVPFGVYGWTVHHWLSYANIPHLALRLDRDNLHMYQAIRDIVRLSASGNLKSCTLIMEGGYLSDIDVRPDEVVSSDLGFQCNEAMLGRLSLLIYCSQELSRIESRKLKVFTPYHPEAMFRLMSATRGYEADKYLEYLCVAFRGELWIDDILYCRDGIQIG